MTGPAFNSADDVERAVVVHAEPPSSLGFGFLTEPVFLWSPTPPQATVS
jgi:hypothetical protein